MELGAIVIEAKPRRSARPTRTTLGVSLEVVAQLKEMKEQTGWDMSCLVALAVRELQQRLVVK